MRTGYEPVEARSPLRMRMALIVFGLLWAAAGLIGFAETAHPVVAALFGVIFLIGVADLVWVRHRMRQGPHFQPGRDVPPYPPADHDPPPGGPGRPRGPRDPRRPGAPRDPGDPRDPRDPRDRGT
jgi:hypothetical protein